MGDKEMQTEDKEIQTVANDLIKQEAQEVLDVASETKRRISNLAFEISYSINPGDTLLEFTDLHSGIYENWFRSYHETILEEAAKKLGIDVEQLENPETRTQEQKECSESSRILQTDCSLFFSGSRP